MQFTQWQRRNNFFSYWKISSEGHFEEILPFYIISNIRKSLQDTGKELN